MADAHAHLWKILLVACGVGVLSGLLGVGGGIVLIPMLVLVFHFEQHKAQGTSLVALVPPTGLLAFIGYAQAHYVDWKVGLLLIPGVFIGGILGGRLAGSQSDWSAKEDQRNRSDVEQLALRSVLCAVPCGDDADCGELERCQEVFARTAVDALQNAPGVTRGLIALFVARHPLIFTPRTPERSASLQALSTEAAS